MIPKYITDLIEEFNTMSIRTFSLPMRKEGVDAVIWMSKKAELKGILWATKEEKTHLRGINVIWTGADRRIEVCKEIIKKIEEVLK